MYPLWREIVLLFSGRVQRLREMRRAIQFNLDELPFCIFFFFSEKGKQRTRVVGSKVVDMATTG